MKRFALVMTLAACGKPSDLGPIQEETTAIAAQAQGDVAELAHRLASVRARNSQVPESVASIAADRATAQQKIGAAATTIDRLKAELDHAGAKLAELVKRVNEAKDAAEKDAAYEDLLKETSELEEHIHEGTTVAGAYLTSAEAWLDRVDSMPRSNPPPAMPDEPPMPAPTL